jgi:hypothetical protein
MHYDFIAIPDAEVPQTREAIFHHVVATYASEANKTVSVWRAVTEELLDFKPHEKSYCLPERNPWSRPTSTSTSGW